MYAQWNEKYKQVSSHLNRQRRHMQGLTEKPIKLSESGQISRE